MYSSLLQPPTVLLETGILEWLLDEEVEELSALQVPEGSGVDRLLVLDRRVA